MKLFMKKLEWNLDATMVHPCLWTTQELFTFSIVFRKGIHTQPTFLYKHIYHYYTIVFEYS